MLLLLRCCCCGAVAAADVAFANAAATDDSYSNAATDVASIRHYPYSYSQYFYSVGVDSFHIIRAYRSSSCSSHSTATTILDHVKPSFFS